jgi:hypothetical protein
MCITGLFIVGCFTSLVSGCLALMLMLMLMSSAGDRASKKHKGDQGAVHMVYCGVIYCGLFYLYT